MESSSSQERNERSESADIDEFVVRNSRDGALEKVFSMDIVGLTNRVRAARENAYSTWSAPQAAGYLLAYLDRIPGFEIDDQTTSDVARGLRSRHGLIEACSRREDVTETDRQALQSILALVGEAYVAVVDSDDIRHSDVLQAFEVVRQEANFAFGIT